MAILDRLKKIDGLVIKSFVGPYLLSFFVAQFVLTMQFLWKYIDDILGKGFSVLDLMELITYFAVMQIPMALPIAMLLSSVMVFGNMSERYELSSMKSAGISLVRIMRPAIVLALSTAALSLIASNYLKPNATFQFKNRLRIMKSQKPSLTIEPKIFNRDFGGYSIRVNEKDDETQMIADVYIYDHTGSDKSLVNLTRAKSGKMYNSEDGRSFVMELENGTSYREMKRERKKEGTGKKYPFMRTEFEEWKKIFDMSEFDTEDGDEMFLSNKKEDMLNTIQLLQAIDSVDQKKAKLLHGIINEDEIERQRLAEIEATNAKNKEKLIKEAENHKVNNQGQQKKKRTTSAKDKAKRAIKEAINGDQIMPSTVIKNEVRREILQNQVDTLSVYQHWHQTLSPDDKNNLPIKAIQASSKRRDLLRNATASIKTNTRKRKKYVLRLHQQYSFALICVIFLFIGAPLGSIIRKGGYGYPLLFAIIFYMIFIITTIMGEKLAIKSQTMHPIYAAWFANILVLPVAIWLTVKALRDSKFEQIGWFVKLVAFIGKVLRLS